MWVVGFQTQVLKLTQNLLTKLSPSLLWLSFAAEFSSFPKKIVFYVGTWLFQVLLNILTLKFWTVRVDATHAKGRLLRDVLKFLFCACVGKTLSAVWYLCFGSKKAPTVSHWLSGSTVSGLLVWLQFLFSSVRLNPALPLSAVSYSRLVQCVTLHWLSEQSSCVHSHSLQ